MIPKGISGRLSAGLLLLASTIATPAVAQDAEKGWDFVVAPYLLAPHMSGEVTVRGISAEIDAGPSDIFSKLDFGAMLYLEMNNPKWAIGLDGLYMNLGDSGETPLTKRKTDIDMQQFALEAKGLWRAAPWAEVGIGGRLNVLDAGLQVAPGTELPGSDVSNSYTWFDPLIVARLMATFDSPWRIGISGDFGGFGIGSDYAWQVGPFVGYRFGSLFELAGAYRALGMKYETGSASDLFVYDMVISGFEIGLLFHF